jgi:hypothetical protein
MAKVSTKLQTGAGLLKVYSRLFFRNYVLVPFVALEIMGCTILATRPNQEMANTAAALRAAREVQADTLAPEYYRQATEWFFRAKHEYKFKNFDVARGYASKARRFAEEAEFEALRNGGNRSDQAVSDPLDNAVDAANPNRNKNNQQQPTPSAPKAAATPDAYPTPEGTPADVYDQRKAAEDQALQQRLQQNSQSNSKGSGLGINFNPVVNPNNLNNSQAGANTTGSGSTTGTNPSGSTAPAGGTTANPPTDNAAGK